MKKSLRFASAALAVALAASCAAPAFAAGGSSFTKSETVYAVMNADGSIQSTTVSEHVYSASGLSKVTDQSTLTNIQNTESSAEFTQDGEKLVWNTDDTDVYYKGDTDRALPIQATVTYALDGQEAALEDLIGKSGHLTMTIALKNNETDTVNVNGTDRTIVTPLVTAVGVIFGQDATNVVAAHGLVESAAKSNVAAFVTLPGVKDSLSGLLPDELDTIEDYLQDTITVEADVTGLTCPQVMMACATSAAALGTDNVFDLSSINDLTDGINQLNDAMSQLLDGTSQLEDGTTQLASGVLALLDGAFSGQIHPYLLNFMKLLCERGAFGEMAACQAEYISCYNEKHGIVPAKVFSAEALSDEQLARLKAALERTSGKHVTLDVHVDAALVGGMRVEMAGKSYDNTLESRMDHLRRVLAARS